MGGHRCMRGTLHYIMREHLATVMRVYGLDPGESDKCERWAKHYGVRIKDLQPWEEPVCEVVCCSVGSVFCSLPLTLVCTPCAWLCSWISLSPRQDFLG